MENAYTDAVSFLAREELKRLKGFGDVPDRRAHHRYILYKALYMEFLCALRLLLPHFSRGGRIEVVTVARALLPADWMIRAVVSVSAAPLGKVLARDALLVRVLFRHSSCPLLNMVPSLSKAERVAPKQRLIGWSSVFLFARVLLLFIW